MNSGTHLSRKDSPVCVEICGSETLLEVTSLEELILTLQRPFYCLTAISLLVGLRNSKLLPMGFYSPVTHGRRVVLCQL